VRCSEPRASLRSTFCVFAIHPLAASRALQGSGALVLCHVRSMRALLLVFVFAASALASDSLRELAADKYGPRSQAKEAGVDYVTAVKRAERGDRVGLSTLFRVTKHLDGHGSETHCIILRQLLELQGDKRFSDALRTESADTRKRVLESLDFDFAAPWQKKFPLTYALGPHNMSLLQERKKI